MNHLTQRFLLASSSTYRKTLLRKCIAEFETHSPNVDETRHTSEAPSDLVERLSKLKAEALKQQFPNHIIIGSDQVASISTSTDILGKPHTFENALAQLQACSGKTVRFFTGLSICGPNFSVTKHETFDVKFKDLSDIQIKSYLYKEEPYDCAGSFKSEGLGILLFDQLIGRDPNSLVGLPLILLNEILCSQGIDLLSISYPHQAD